MTKARHQPFTSRGRPTINRWRIATLIPALLLTVSCLGWWEELPTYGIINNTDQTLELVGLRTTERGFELTGESQLDSLEPGERRSEAIGRNDCEPLVLVVRTLDGAEYAQEPHQMCANHEWIITGPDS